MIKLEDGGPMIHRRTVLGLGGTGFEALKLRTMRPDADQWLAEQTELAAQYEKTFKLADDPRITSIGCPLRKLSIDELPQLINVIRGDMSLVGPRMIHPAELKKFGEFGPLRMSIKPGVTGLWQVSGRDEADYLRRIELDREYLEKRSLGFDLLILFTTLPAVVSRRGAI